MPYNTSVRVWVLEPSAWAQILPPPCMCQVILDGYLTSLELRREAEAGEGRMNSTSIKDMINLLLSYLYH